VEEKLLRVAGAGLYYRTQGSGPLLLLIQGGGGDADGTNAIAARLTGHYTVLTYDRRGLSRSKLDGPHQAPGISTHVDDLHRVLEAVTDEPVLAFGTSFGAALGLELIARYPGRIRLLVAHEPPATQFSPDGQGVRELGLDFEDREPGVEFEPPTAQQQANDIFFRDHDVPAISAHRFDTDALRAGQARFLLAVGATSGKAFPRQCTEGLASFLGKEVVSFPGSHVGLLTHPAAFAAKLRETLPG
jgi:pimeloyl-ACP methyl ester carboxylesterase